MKINTQKVNLLRINKGLTLTQLSKLSNLSKTTMTRILKPDYSVRPDTIGKIARVLGVSAMDLLKR